MTDNHSLTCGACGTEWPGGNGNWRCPCGFASVDLQTSAVVIGKTFTTDNQLVEAVARAISGQDAAGWQNLPEDDREIWEHNDGTRDGYRHAATAALRAIEDAGWKVVKKEDG